MKVNIEKFRELIAHRIHVDDISSGEWDDEIEKCWKMEMEILTEDIPSAIDFLKNECTADEYSWISEVIEDIAAQTQSREFVDAYKSLMKKFPEECQTYNISGIIQFAEDALNSKQPISKEGKKMNIEKFREVIARRIYVEDISQGEWADGIEECMQKEIEILTEDIPSAIEFLKNECTADEYSWISEVIDDVAVQTQSREFLDAYKSLMEKFPEECQTYNIAGSIQFAEEALDSENSNGEES